MRALRHPAAHLARRLAAALVVVLAVGAGIGWLYALRDSSALRAGPLLSGGLPLERLAGQDRQPLARVLAGWIPVGLAAGVALAGLTRRRRLTRALLASFGAWVVLFALGAGSDAVTASEALGPHLAPQLGRGALWAAAGAFGLGAFIAPSRAARSRAGRATAAAATRSAGSARGAA